MAIYREDIVKQAEKWIGYKEANGTHKKIIDLYNSYKPLARGYKVKYTDAWCSTFVSAVAIAANATSIIPTECGCQEQIKRFVSIGSWMETDSYIPKPGDVIFYDWNDSGSGDNKGYADHVGIVQKVVSGVIYVIEGNYNNAVGIRKIKVNAKTIRGYGVPKYDTKQTVSKSVDIIAREVIAGKWGNGESRKKKLTAAGYDYATIQKRVNELLR